jgi:ATP-dependent exoDNAse (exonuclease V) beta subunit
LLPSIQLPAEDWIGELKKGIQEFCQKIGAPPVPKIGTRLKLTGLSKSEKEAPLAKIYEATKIRIDTAHKVKGETLDGLLFITKARFINSVMREIEGEKNTFEDTRVAYVAMTRAKHLLVIAVPVSHYSQYAAKWSQFGFKQMNFEK